MNVLALSSSRVGDSGYLQPAIPYVKDLVGTKPLRIAFIPFATVGIYEDYYNKVSDAFSSLPYSIELLTIENGNQLLGLCNAVMVGGGNTFKLLHDLYETELIDPLRARVLQGLSYIGWSAGSNILCPTIGTTNDMPIIQPRSFQALNIFPFQINPHFFNQPIAGFNGETRMQRIEEYLTLNQKATVVAMPEGSALVRNNKGTIFRGERGFHFSRNQTQIIEVGLNDGDSVE